MMLEIPKQKRVLCRSCGGGGSVFNYPEYSKTHAFSYKTCEKCRGIGWVDREPNTTYHPEDDE